MMERKPSAKAGIYAQYLDDYYPYCSPNMIFVAAIILMAYISTVASSAA